MIDESSISSIHPKAAATMMDRFKAVVRSDLARRSTVAGFTINDVEAALAAATTDIGIITSDTGDDDIGVAPTGEDPEAAEWMFTALYTARDAIELADPGKRAEAIEKLKPVVRDALRRADPDGSLEAEYKSA